MCVDQNLFYAVLGVASIILAFAGFGLYKTFTRKKNDKPTVA